MAAEQREEKEKKVLKPTNIRISDQTIETFRKIASNKEFTNQDEALAAMIEAYQREQVKEALPNRAKEIELFQQTLSILSSKYIEIIQDYELVEERVKTEFKLQFSSKEEIIQDLQKGKKELSSQLEEAIQKEKQANLEKESIIKDKLIAEEQITRLTQQLEKMEKETKRIIEDKDFLYQMARKQLQDKEEQLKEYKQLKELVRQQDNQLVQQQRENKELEKRNEKEQIEQKEKELIYKAALLDIRSEYEEKIKQIKDDYNLTLSQLKQFHEEQLERKNKKIEDYQEKIEKEFFQSFQQESNTSTETKL